MGFLFILLLLIALVVYLSIKRTLKNEQKELTDDRLAGRKRKNREDEKKELLQIYDQNLAGYDGMDLSWGIIEAAIYYQFYGCFKKKYPYAIEKKQEFLRQPFSLYYEQLTQKAINEYIQILYEGLNERKRKSGYETFQFPAPTLDDMLKWYRRLEK